MVLTEFRVPLPLTVEEFQVAQLYMVVKASKENTKGGEGVEWLKNEPFDNTDGHMGVAERSGVEIPKRKGQYTLKIYHLESHIPWAVKSMLPATAMVLVEEAWNCYPYCKTVLTNGYLAKEKFRIIITSVHVADKGDSDNALGLSADQLKARKVETLDVAALDPAEDNYKAEHDPTKFLSEKTGRGHLTKGWQDTAKPVMTCYKLVDASFKYWMLQSKIEGNIEANNRALFRRTLAQAFCLIDEWHGMTMKDIRRLEAESKAELNAQLGHAAGDESKTAETADAAAADAAAASPAAGTAPSGAGAGAGAGAGSAPAAAADAST